MGNNDKFENITESRMLRRRFIVALVVVLILSAVIGGVTLAWYIYNTNSKTTDVHMAAGTNMQLEIASKYDGEYSYASNLEQLKGTLTPVSTDKITGGFQQCVGFQYGTDGEASALAKFFGPSKTSYYYKGTVFIRTNANDIGVYVSDMDYAKSEEAELMATACRVGLVVHEPGKDKPVSNEYIFAISDKKNPNGRYNTYNGKPGCVLDHTKTDGSVVDFSDKLLSKKNFAKYDKENAKVELTGDSKKLFNLSGFGKQGAGTPVQVDVYIWLEGCDEDCTNSLGGFSLGNVAVSFVGIDNKPKQ